MQYVGLDFETSGLRPEEGHVPLSLGFAWESEPLIAVRYWTFESAGEWDVEAMMVNKLHAPVQHSLTISAGEADWELCEWLIEFTEGELGTLVPVGWNVGSFDMRFMHKYFPNATKFFSHRPFELNTQVECCAMTLLTDTGRTLKEKIKNEIEEEAGDVKWHNAGFDAWASLRAKQLMDELLKSHRPQMKNSQ